MVRARAEFLGLGHFAPIATALADAAATLVGDRQSDPAARSAGCVADLGAGTGYYLAGALARLQAHVGLAVDVSMYATRAAPVRIRGSAPSGATRGARYLSPTRSPIWC
jgi:23S rRNA (guanine745-N1)-methyltransferase